MEPRYPLLDHLHDCRGVYRDLSPLEAFGVVDWWLIRVCAVSMREKHVSRLCTGGRRERKDTHVSFQIAKCLMPNACDVQW